MILLINYIILNKLLKLKKNLLNFMGIGDWGLGIGDW